MSTSITTPDVDIRAFAAAVRAELDDLPPEEVDDLLDGLEADLAEQASDSGEGFSLPDARPTRRSSARRRGSPNAHRPSSRGSRGGRGRPPHCATDAPRSPVASAPTAPVPGRSTCSCRCAPCGGWAGGG